MREKLIELIEQAEEQADKRCDFAENCDQCPADNHTINCLDWLKADCLIANGVTIQKWIPVTERLPDLELVEVRADDMDLFPCLVVKTAPKTPKKRFVTKAWYDDGHFMDSDCIYITKYVTHWMPLPEPPSGERKTDDK